MNHEWDFSCGEKLSWHRPAHDDDKGTNMMKNSRISKFFENAFVMFISWIYETGSFDDYKLLDI